MEWSQGTTQGGGVDPHYKTAPGYTICWCVVDGLASWVAWAMEKGGTTRLGGANDEQGAIELCEEHARRKADAAARA